MTALRPNSDSSSKFIKDIPDLRGRNKKTRRPMPCVMQGSHMHRACSRPDASPPCHDRSRNTADHVSDTRTASLFRNASNLAVRLPTDWIAPDVDIGQVQLVRQGDDIVVRPILGQTLTEPPDGLAQTPGHKAELEGLGHSPVQRRLTHRKAPPIDSPIAGTSRANFTAAAFLANDASRSASSGSPGFRNSARRARSSA